MQHHKHIALSFPQHSHHIFSLIITRPISLVFGFKYCLKKLAVVGSGGKWYHRSFQVYGKEVHTRTLPVTTCYNCKGDNFLCDNCPCDNFQGDNFQGSDGFLFKSRAHDESVPLYGGNMFQSLLCLNMT